MNKKLKVFLDFDSTIVDSVKRFVEIANSKYGTNKSPSELGTYDFKNLCPNITKAEVYEIFATDEFFDDKLEFMPNAIEVLEKYKNDIDFYISTAAYGRNYELKKKWVAENLPFVKGFYSSTSNDKSNIDMRYAIQIDDIYECLKYTNAYIKILYKNFNNYKWQRYENDETIYDINDWNEIELMFDYYLKEGLY